MFGLEMSFAENYSFLDRSLHHLAYSIPGLQKFVAEMESDIYAKDLNKIGLGNEIFVTSLPRSGTTLLLDLLHKTDEFCTFSYRHMPFILAPLFWKKISQPFSKDAKEVERAHGDGMTVSFDSPEAFEEVVWLSYLKQQYVNQDKLAPLTLKNTNKKFAKAINSTIKKLILENHSEGQAYKRYISKNNANCSRLPVLKKLFPTATILIPFREPFAHIGSLMKQHEQFCEMHKDDSFAKSYMKWLGHYDFGENFKPINFDNWLDSQPSKPDYQSESFWLSYWIASYENILRQISDKVHLVDYNKLLVEPAETLTKIAEITKLKNIDSFSSYASEIRNPTSKPKNTESIDSELVNQANNLYQRLQESAL
jgi:hypothetical protein